MVSPSLYLISGSLVAIEAFLAFLIYYKLRGASEAAMASFQLNQEDVIRDFKIIVISGIPLLIGGIIYVLGGFMENDFLKNFGYTGGIVTTILLDYVLYRWWRRF